MNNDNKQQNIQHKSTQYPQSPQKYTIENTVDKTVDELIESIRGEIQHTLKNNAQNEPNNRWLLKNQEANKYE